MLSTMRQRVLAIGTSGSVVAALLVFGAGSAASAATTTLTPVADAYVQADTPDVNYGTAPTLVLDASPITNSYLKFAVSGTGGTVSKATLRLYTAVAHSTPIDVYAVADTSWGETAITYNTAPPIGTKIVSSGAQTAGQYVSIDVTSAVKGDGTYSFALKTTNTASRSYDSKEGANPPQLILETGTTSPSTSPTSTAPSTSPTSTAPSTSPTSTSAAASGDPVVVVGGDVACAPDDANYNGGNGVTSYCHMKTTAGLIGKINPSALLMVGDGQYNSGSLANYRASYDPSWGVYKSKTKPAVGNHDYGTSGAAGYYTYFGTPASPQQSGCTSNCLGYYSFDVGAWHLVNINSECSRLNGGAGCAAGSPQETWLKNDLANHKTACTIVFDHRPRWSSNSFASADIAPLINDANAAGVDLLLSGHAHSYERFAPQNGSGGADANGIRQFVVGTGGSFFTGFSTIVANSQVHKSNIFGVMKLTLHSNSYDWSFVADSSTPYTDSGTGSCH
jgi:calcineurin-like phosphoesterase family protein